MKKIVSIFFACLCAYVSNAQTPASWYHYTEEFWFVKEVPASSLQGKNFRYEIAVKADPADSLSRARIHGVGIDAGQQHLLNSGFTVETRTEQEWTIYTVVGKVLPTMHKLSFYASVNGNGQFYFDDISFYVEEQPGRWKQQSLFNASFEEKQPDIFAGFAVNKRRSFNIQTRLTSDVYKTGQQSLLVITKGASPIIATAQTE
ncbi:hypothetical protein [Paraflavitalea pollutisoli]|uniref:hypothetical protein n=1 Tax=Paraflavitalea pollutisoli TaxID=3034143 RepID=UPI0023EC117C|nr:hypothetical protein [Paraflavitalea sp. H1-2-19X]